MAESKKEDYSFSFSAETGKTIFKKCTKIGTKVHRNVTK